MLLHLKIEIKIEKDGKHCIVGQKLVSTLSRFELENFVKLWLTQLPILSHYHTFQNTEGHSTCYRQTDWQTMHCCLEWNWGYVFINTVCHFKQLVRSCPQGSLEFRVQSTRKSSHLKSASRLVWGAISTILDKTRNLTFKKRCNKAKSLNQ